MSKIEIKGKNLLVLIVLIVIIILGYIYRDDIFKTKTASNTATSSKTYSAVFLSNGQVYFGVLKNATTQYLELVDIYYLQTANQNVQPKDKEENKETKLELVKLGKELHGPKDKMMINRDQVLFYEELKDDSQVVQIIQKDKQGATE
ncbi:MAG: hypothetical protein CEN89_424 [Candidatus Berkelbacteria bacterium Licking1014_7]|uniref:Uncharacterized protein n=1 Tax=Candidatus Berkelbacteria bacterium Licking1014_7 TaxID=2017147 RepID=A0A554LJ10_9BACT|nr:MAG: hypothetical protein CEN89_424 [Candidatus Berkelbacteria bacterium Licking1014_7]